MNGLTAWEEILREAREALEEVRADPRLRGAAKAAAIRSAEQSVRTAERAISILKGEVR